MLTQDDFRALLELDKAIDKLFEAVRILGTGDSEADGVVGAMFNATEILRRHSKYRQEDSDTFGEAEWKAEEYRVFLQSDIPIEEKARTLYEEQAETI